MMMNAESKPLGRPKIRNARIPCGTASVNLIPVKEEYVWKLMPDKMIDKGYKDEEQLCVAANQNFARLFGVERFPLKRLFGSGNSKSKPMTLVDICDVLVRNDLEFYEDEAIAAANRLIHGNGFLVGRTLIGDPLYCAFSTEVSEKGIRYQLSIQRGWPELTE